MPDILRSLPAIFYVLICFFFGVQLLRFLFPDAQRIFIGIAPKRAALSLLPTVLFYYPAGMIIGLQLITFITYFIAYVMTPFMPRDMAVLYPANVVSLGVSLYLASLFWQKRYTKRNAQPVLSAEAEALPVRRRLGSHRTSPVAAAAEAKQKPDFQPSAGSIVFYVLSILFFTSIVVFLFYYSYHVENQTLFAGYSVFSDLAPHTAIISSFSKGLNFPTVYPHFPDGSIRYHFLFYFLCGNLNALGMPIDHALNIPSVLSAVSCFLLLGDLAVLLFGRKSAFLLSPVLVLFRSSFAVLHQAISLATAPGATISSILSGIVNNTEFIGVTPYDNWGLWAINVYANQRHLLFGMALILILLFFFLPHVRRMFLHMRKVSGFKAKLHQFLLCREAWLPRKNDPIRPVHLAVLSAVLLFCMPYFHGSALIALLLILFFLAIFSENRLSYVLVAVVAVLSSLAQTYFFSGGAGNVVTFSFFWGFVVANPTILEVALYVAELTGISLLLLIVSLFIQKSAYRAVFLLACGLPAVFAFLFAMTIDVTSNHKFIQISLILFSVFIGGVLSFLLSPFSAPVKAEVTQQGQAAKPEIKRIRIPDPELLAAPSVTQANEDTDDLTNESAPRKKGRKVLRIFALIGTRLLAVILLVLLTASGISDTIVYINKNRNSIQVDLNSPVTQWITENTSSASVFLTAPFAMHEFFLSGRYAYFGHPYYAWSAGYDTYKRSDMYAMLLTGCGGDKEAFLALCRQEGISYIMIDNEMRSNAEYPLNIEFFTTQLSAEANFPEENNTVIYSVS